MLAAAARNTITESSKPSRSVVVLRALDFDSPCIVCNPGFGRLHRRNDVRQVLGLFITCAQTTPTFSTERVHWLLTVAGPNFETEC